MGSHMQRGWRYPPPSSTHPLGGDGQAKASRLEAMRPKGTHMVHLSIMMLLKMVMMIMLFVIKSVVLQLLRLMVWL